MQMEAPVSLWSFLELFGAILSSSLAYERQSVGVNGGLSPLTRMLEHVAVRETGHPTSLWRCYESGTYCGSRSVDRLCN